MERSVGRGFRIATVEDVDAIVAIARECWARDYPAVVSREAIPTAVGEWYDPDRIEREVGRPDAVVTVATREGTVCGFAHAVQDDGVGTVLRLYVAPGQRGEGTGRDLLAFTLEELGERGAGLARAMVLAENDPGNAFYRSCGFSMVESGETTIADETYPEYVYERQIR